MGNCLTVVQKKICNKNTILFDNEIFNNEKVQLTSSIYCSPICIVASAKTEEITKIWM